MQCEINVVVVAVSHNYLLTKFVFFVYVLAFRGRHHPGSFWRVSLGHFSLFFCECIKNFLASFVILTFKYLIFSPEKQSDLRHSSELCDEEKGFREKRKATVFEAMKKLLGERGPQNMDEVGGVFEQFSLNWSAKIVAWSSVSLNEFTTRELQLMIYIILSQKSV